ncbi:MAG: 23S rRNA (uracil(1939)-C(5))-methyltransferase RlmD [Streptococcaceae bacterium]|jgi:23S rRNA (uracil-5-)-methyltransferase RumA|nr:23S rRNA (uracil(1939)-C(5))-methyltransferase RlmD [Streptococcaceae bacterium]
MVLLKQGYKYPLHIEKLGINGEGIGYIERRLVFAPYALPGEDVLVKITENAPRFSRAEVLQVKTKSPDRVKAPDTTYAELSSSHIMHLAYPAQLAFKTDLIRQSLQKYKPENWQNIDVRPTLASAETIGYRYKLTYQVRKLKNGKVIAGLYKENSHHLVNLEHCLVQEAESQEIANLICRLAEKYQLPIYDERHNQGLRTLMIRKSHATGEIQIVFVTSLETLNLEKLVTDLTTAHPHIQNIAVNFNPRKTSDIYGEKTWPLWRGDKAKDTITESALGTAFELSPRAFYQLNPAQAEILYNEAAIALQPKKTDHLVDAYCGAGSIGLTLAKKVASVHGMDTIPESVNDARDNAYALGFKNCHYEIGKAEKVISNMFKSGYKINSLIVDPPRTGLDDELLKTLVRYPLDKMVYISCNASTLAKDLRELTKIYRIDYIQSVDMFPHTARVEAVVRLTKKES